METDRAIAFAIVTLRGDATMQGLVNNRIVSDMADPGTQYPFVVVGVLSDGNDLRVVGGIRIWTNPLLLIKGVTKGNNPGQLRPIAKRINELLDLRSGTITDGVIVVIERERGHYRPEYTDGARYLNMGGEYRFKVQ